VKWRKTPTRVAAEALPAGWAMIAATAQPDGNRRVAAAGVFDSASPSLAADLREFRVSAALPTKTSVVLWPRPVDPGVVALDARPRGRVELPKAVVIRERVAPLVRAGGQVDEVVLPHHAIIRLARMRGWPSACVLALHRHGACLSQVEGDLAEPVYLHWAAADPFADAGAKPAAKLLSRYQFAARIAPYVREFVGTDTTWPLAVCGNFHDLRAAMVPIIEELDRDIEILDGPLTTGSEALAPGGPDESALQLVWAVAADTAQP
jgi:hypothetical protein